MKNYKECANGHYYQDHLDFCPYCPTSQVQPSFGSTVIDENANRPSHLDRTIIEDSIVSEPTISTKNQNRDLSKTFVQHTENDKNADTPVSKAVERRKLMGWLVTFSIDEFGRDFRIYEGRNTIGSAADNDIILSNDVTVSAHHAVILFRNETFYIKDNMSTNGTKLNDKDLEPEQSYTFEDNATLSVGNILLQFRKA